MVLLNTYFEIAAATALMAATALGLAVSQPVAGRIEPRDNIFNRVGTNILPRSLNPSSNNGVKEKFSPKKSGSEEEAPAPRGKEKQGPNKPNPKDGKKKGPTINRGGNAAPKEEAAEPRKSRKGPLPHDVGGDENVRPDPKRKVNTKFPSPPQREDPQEKKKAREGSSKGSREAARNALGKGGPSDERGYSEARKQPQPPPKPRQQKQAAVKGHESPPASEGGADSDPNFQWYKGNGKTPTNYVQDTKNAWVQKFKGKYLPEPEKSD